MLILSLDSAGQGCGVCLWQDNKVLSHRVEAMERGQDRRLIPLITEAMAEANVEFEQLDRIAVTRGPGSFTGLRIGLAAANGFGLALGKPVIGINRFAVYRTRFPAANLLVVLQSKRAELFCQHFPANGEAAEPVALTLPEIQQLIAAQPDLSVAGDCETLQLPQFMQTPTPEVIAAANLAATALPGDPAYAPRPLYLRPPDVTFAKAAV